MEFSFQFQQSFRRNGRVPRAEGRWVLLKLLFSLFLFLQLIASVAPAPSHSDDEPSINPFLSHIEQTWKLKPVRHRYLRKPKIQKNIHDQDGELSGTSPLEMDLSKPHFMDSNEAADAIADENRAFGDEEKDLRELFNVLFSSDY